MNPLELRAFIGSLEESVESSHFGKPDFRYRNKIVVNLNEAENAVTIKLSVDEQTALVERSSDVFSLPGGWAKHGWTTISLAAVDDDELRELITGAWDEMVASQNTPKKATKNR